MLQDFIESNNLNARIIGCRQPVHTVKQASEEFRCSPEEIIKSIVFLDEKNNPVLAIVLGNGKVSEKKLLIATGSKSLRIASGKEVWDNTGYEAGGVPPISVFGVRTVIDEKVMLKEIVTGGGGDEMHLLKITTKELLANAFEPMVKDISE